MKCALILAFVFAPLSAIGNDVPVSVSTQLASAAEITGAKVVVTRFTPQSRVACDPDRVELKQRIEGSGRVALRYFGKSCDGWAWADVQVFAPVLVTNRAVKSGEVMTDVVKTAERELRRGHQPVALVNDETTAARGIPAGTVVEKSDVRQAQPKLGSTIGITLVAGAIQIEDTGRVVPCSPDRVCVLLPSGKRLDGQMKNGRVWVEVN